MHRGLFCAALAVTTGLSMRSTTITGQASDPPVAGIELAGSTNLIGKDVKVDALLFVPKSVKQVRAVIVFVHYGNTWRLYESSAWRKAAESIESALLLARPSSIDARLRNSAEETKIFRDASMGGADGVLTVLRQLAADSQHPELQNAPLAFWGWSAAAGFGATFAKEHPQRTLAFIRYHTHQREWPVDVNITKDIPVLLLAGGRDKTAGVEDAEILARRGRAAGAPWTFVIEPNVPHGIIDGNINVEFFTNSSELMIPWLTAVVRHRIPQAGAAMRMIADDVGWIGDHKTGEVLPSAGFTGSKSDKTWLPDEASARGWQRIRVADNPARPIQ